MTAAHFSETYNGDRHRGLEADEAKVVQLLNNLNAKLEAYEVILGKQAYLAGEVSVQQSGHVPRESNQWITPERDLGRFIPPSVRHNCDRRTGVQCT